MDSKETASWLCLLAAAPVAVAGFFSYNGLTTYAAVKITIINRRLNSVDFQRTILMKERGTTWTSTAGRPTASSPSGRRRATTLCRRSTVNASDKM